MKRLKENILKEMNKEICSLFKDDIDNEEDDIELDNISETLGNPKLSQAHSQTSIR